MFRLVLVSIFLVSSLMLSSSSASTRAVEHHGQRAQRLQPATGQPASPSDDPNDYAVDTSVEYEPVLGPVQWLTRAGLMPPEIEELPSNNNCAIAFHDGRLYFSWRTGPTHFASTEVVIYVVSSGDMGQTWEYEATVDLDRDIREPNFLSMNGELQLSFFEGGTNPLGFEPRRMWRMWRKGLGQWTGHYLWGIPEMVPWDWKVRDGVAYLTAYQGEHYTSQGYGNVDVYFYRSFDGHAWEPVGPNEGIVYNGGVSEVGFEFDAQGNMWAVTRNEDGDQSGFGSHLVFAPANDLSNWEFPAESSPLRYDSPKMFRHGDDVYLLARRDPDGAFDQELDGLPFDNQRILNWVAYSLRRKRFALYKINQSNREIEHIVDLPGTGDTAFPSVHRLDANRFLLVNYTSPLDKTAWTWIQGQVAPEGTDIYMMELSFEPVSP